MRAPRALLWNPLQLNWGVRRLSTSMLHWILGIVGAGLAWLAWELVSEILGEGAWFATGPLRRPVWSVFVTASWPWPLAVMMLVGAGAAWLGLRELRLELASWRRTIGIVAFLGGCGITLFAPFLWRDARRAGREVRDRDQPSNYR